MDSAFIPSRIATSMNAFEGVIEDTIRQGHALYGELVDARRDLKVSPPAAQSVMTEVQEALAALALAQSKMSNAHMRADVLQRKLGLRTVGTGVWKDAVGAVEEEDRAVSRSA